MAATAAVKPVPIANRVIDFCARRFNQVEMNRLMEANPTGMSDRAALDLHLKEGRYIEVLTALWTEKDRGQQLEWLRSKKEEYHAPLLYELALAELRADCTPAKVQDLSIPLIMAAAVRTQQDLACCLFTTQETAHLSHSVYTKYLKSVHVLFRRLRALSEKQPCSEQELTEIFKKGRENTPPLLLAIEEKTKRCELPDPCWIAPSTPMGTKGVMKPPDRWHELRLAWIKRCIELNHEIFSSSP